MSQIKNIVIALLIIIFFISFIVNKKFNDFICKGTLEFKINKIKVNIKVKTLVINLCIIFTFFMIISVCAIVIFSNLKYYFEDPNEFDVVIAESDKKIKVENDFYNEIINKVYNIENCKNPYIFDGFTYVEGTWDTGFVIQDENKNQYVWVPCTNKENNENIEILKKTNFSDDVFINKFDCNEENYEEFLKSSLENGGFYISRFEIGKNESNNPVSQKDYEVWTNITKKEAEKLANNMYNNINSELINGYAYDIAFSWIINNENVEFTERKKDKIYSGTKSYKNIYDIIDDIYEITSEKYYGNMVYRGIIADSKYAENVGFDNRLVGNINYENKSLSFRTVLYK